jgi:hypothetical protein
MAAGFAAIRARAEQRKGGAGALAELLPALNGWARETGLSYVALSRICAMSVGDNLDAQTLLQRMHGDE